MLSFNLTFGPLLGAAHECQAALFHGFSGSRQHRSVSTRPARFFGCLGSDWPPPFGRRARQRAEQEHGLAAGRAAGCGCGFGFHPLRTLPIQQGQNARPLVLGGGSAPAIVAHALEALGQDVLQKAAHELAAADGAVLLRAAVLAVTERHVPRIPVFNLAFVQRRLDQVVGQIFQGRLAAAHRLNVGHPLKPPDFGGHLLVQFRRVLF